MRTRTRPGDDARDNPAKYILRRAQAEARVMNALRAVDRQSKIVATLRRRGLNSSDAEVRLAQLNQKLSQFQEQLASIITDQANNY